MRNIRCRSPSITLARPLDAQWKVSRLFGSLGSWIHGDLNSSLLEGKNDEVGAARLVNGPLGTFKERLVEHSDADRFYCYNITESALPIRNPVGKISFTPSSTGLSSCVLDWEVSFDASPKFESSLSGAVTRMLEHYAEGAKNRAAGLPQLERTVAPASSSREDRVSSVLNYWFTSVGNPEANYSLWYDGTPGIDADITNSFATDLFLAEAGVFDHWMDHGPLSALALIIIKDQFALNIYRDEPEGYNSSTKAISNSYTAIAKGYDRQVCETMRPFFYLPLMHSEKLIDQEKCVDLFNANFTAPGANEYAVIHRDIVKKYGRFPGRNKVMGRKSTPEEEIYLRDGGVF